MNTQYWSCGSLTSELLNYLHLTPTCVLIIPIREKHPKHRNDYRSILLDPKLCILSFTESTRKHTTLHITFLLRLDFELSRLYLLFYRCPPTRSVAGQSSKNMRVTLLKKKKQLGIWECSEQEHGSKLPFIVFSKSRGFNTSLQTEAL